MEVKYRCNGKQSLVTIFDFQMPFYMEVILLGQTEGQTGVSHFCKIQNQKLAYQ